MDIINTVISLLEKYDYKISTDTRKDLSDTVFFALKGENFDGNKFTKEALDKGAVAVITEDSSNAGEKIFVVENVLEVLQQVAKEYRKTFEIPIVAIGGSNGKTTSKELLREVLNTKYITHSTIGSLNNHLGVPFSILAMNKETQIAVFEIGANHPHEHLDLLSILNPTHVVVTNNGMDHLEGFGSPEGSRKANKEIYDWALENDAKVFVNQKLQDLIEDSEKCERILYSDFKITVSQDTPLAFSFENKFYQTNLAGSYNLQNIELAVAIGKYFEIDLDEAFLAITKYVPNSKRSEFLTKNGINFIVDCYNANPTSMNLSLQSFLSSISTKKGVVLGDMLELGTYAESEHKKIADFVLSQNFDCIVFVGEKFKKILNESEKYKWFENSEEARKWFYEQNFTNYTFLLKGSRGMKIEKVLEK